MYINGKKKKELLKKHGLNPDDFCDCGVEIHETS